MARLPRMSFPDETWQALKTFVILCHHIFFKNFELLNKVKIQIVFKGREMAHKEIGFDMANKIITLLDEEAIIEQKPQMAGRNLSLVIRSK